MTYFPQINAAGLITQRPYQSGLHYATTVKELPCGQRVAWGWRGMGLTNFPNGPLGQWELNYAAITDAEVDVLRNFFISMQGKYGQFTYLDPGGNLVPHSEDFSASSWSGSITSGVTGQADPFGGTRARAAVPGTASCIILPGGGATGYVLCLSVWVKASAASTATLSLTGAGSSVHQLPAGSWVRVTHSGAVGSGVISGSIALSGSGSIFGAQAVPMRGPGGYMRTPGNPGLHAKCRFDTDIFSPRYAGPNQISLKLPIVEYF